MLQFWGRKGMRQVDQKNNIERSEKDRQDVVFIEWCQKDVPRRVLSRACDKQASPARQHGFGFYSNR